MTQHEYIFIAVSIILGLAITRLLNTMATITRMHERVKFHWASILWSISILVYVLQFWWVGWGLRTVEVWSFTDFVVLVLGCSFIYGAAEMALSVPDEDKLDMLQESQQWGRLSALSMLFYFLVGPYVNILMSGNAILPSIAVPSIGVLIMLFVIGLPKHFPIWSVLFALYSAVILVITV